MELLPGVINQTILLLKDLPSNHSIGESLFVVFVLRGSPRILV